MRAGLLRFELGDGFKGWLAAILDSHAFIIKDVD